MDTSHPDHVGLKDFMKSQIKQSIDFDCSTDCFKSPTRRLSGEGWLAERIAQCERDVEYHKIKHEAEVKRVLGRTAWVKALRQSLIECTPKGVTNV